MRHQRMKEAAAAAEAEGNKRDEAGDKEGEQTEGNEQTRPESPEVDPFDSEWDITEDSIPALHVNRVAVWPVPVRITYFLSMGHHSHRRHFRNHHLTNQPQRGQNPNLQRSRRTKANLARLVCVPSYKHMPAII